ncbi:bifunctional diguanylate cyclase/phosphodiesterase [Streptacidiphilus sp. NEAU-YB345]|uniref:Bifunctional diguanylate cyclase/phosphodiesterase n=1 Tax=Streptacidiphilus fuscans TaxID=2789292 RepID=A0A931AXT6_9ACTN|nr:bifunctional diguanylate cyclase/phosphodiesterase [Streptacidiphilus fuscans]
MERTSRPDRAGLAARVAIFLGVAVAGAAPLVPLAQVVGQHEPLLLPLFVVPVAVLFAAWWFGRQRLREGVTDRLTGLPNRSGLRLAAAQAGNTRDRYGLLLLDLDRFRSLNDTLGHLAGDRLLVQVARRLRTLAAEHGALVARMGGDEFAVLVPDPPRESAELLRLARGFTAGVAVPIHVDGLQLVLESSSGIAVLPDHAPDAESLLRRADIAMAHAQRSRAGVAVYQAGQEEDTPLRLGLLGDLRRALDLGEVQIHYQPKVAFDGSVVGLEALVRWSRAGRGPVSPEEFVGLAESSGLMPQLTDYVLEAAVSQLASWREEGIWVKVAVNVSPRDVLRPGFAVGVADRLARHGVPADALQLEITERLLLEDGQRAAETLEELRKHGVGMSLDDFGTGYSSLVRLRRLPVGELKIDRSFVSRMVADDHDAAVVRCSVQLAHSLGLTVVAEGVEDDETWERLQGMGCDAVQGWLVSAALPADQATAWLRTHVTSAHA